MTLSPEPSECPVCGARFRGMATCSRCGADLAPLMLLMAHAYSLCQKARQSLQQGDARTALTLAQAAQNLHATPEGRLLQAVCSVAARAVRQNSSGPWNE
jgi:hypothetical protein